MSTFPSPDRISTAKSRCPEDDFAYARYQDQGKFKLPYCSINMFFCKHYSDKKIGEQVICTGALRRDMEDNKELSDYVQAQGLLPPATSN